MRRKHLALAVTGGMTLLAAAAFVPVTVESKELNGACFRHRRCSSSWFGLTQECRLYADEEERSRLVRPRAPADECPDEDWFRMSSCSYFVTGSVGCMLRPRSGPGAAVAAMRYLSEEQTSQRKYSGRYLTEAEALERWSPRGSQLSGCGETSLFEPDRYHVVLTETGGNKGTNHCWVLDSQNGLQRIGPK